jgi:hypothetical protein
LSIKIGKDVSIKTWNNAFFDTAHKTLVDPESAAFKRAVMLKVGQKAPLVVNSLLMQTISSKRGALLCKDH